MKKPIHSILLTALCMLAAPLAAQVPQIINYQGKIAVGATPFTGTGQFKFALVDGTGATSYWSNDGTSTAGSEPAAVVSLPVVNGLYVVPLGDTTVGGMTPIAPSVFQNSDVRLRVWFNDGSTGSQLLAPDQRITSVGYAMVAGTVPDGAITTAKLASGIAVPGSMIWETVSGTTQQAVSGRGYIADNAAEVTITLPASPAVGDVVRVSGAGAGGWRVAQNAGQSIAGTGFAELGSTWTQGANLEMRRIASSADGTRLIGAPQNGGTVYTSQDSGVSWTARSTFPTQGSSFLSVASSSDGTKLVAAGDGNTFISTSIDSGVTWTPHNVAGCRAVASSSDGTKLVAVGNQIAV